MKNLINCILVIAILLFNISSLNSKPDFINWESKIEAKKSNNEYIYFSKLLLTKDGNIFSSLSNSKGNFTLAKYSNLGNEQWYFERLSMFIDTNYIERLNMNNIELAEYNSNRYTIKTTKYLKSLTKKGDLFINFSISNKGDNIIEYVGDNSNIFNPSTCIVSSREDSTISMSLISTFNGNPKPTLRKLNVSGKVIFQVDDNELQDLYSSPNAIGIIGNNFVTTNSTGIYFVLNNNDLVVRYYNNQFKQLIDKKITASLFGSDIRYILANNLKVFNNKIYIIGTIINSNKTENGFLLILDEKGEMISKTNFSNNSNLINLIVKDENVYVVGNSKLNSKLGQFLFINYNLKSGISYEKVWGESTVPNNLNDIISDDLNNLIVGGAESINAYIASINMSFTDVKSETDFQDIILKIDQSNSLLEIISNNNIENQNVEITNYIGIMQIAKINYNRIDISNLLSGLYMIKFRIKNQNYFQKFIVNR